jgi:hypothetical protein
MHIYTHDYITFSQKSRYLGDNCIVFDNFTASVGDLMVVNWVNGYLW